MRSLSHHPGRGGAQGSKPLLGLPQYGPAAGRALRSTGHRDADGHGPAPTGSRRPPTIWPGTTPTMARRVGRQPRGTASRTSPSAAPGTSWGSTWSASPATTAPITWKRSTSGSAGKSGREFWRQASFFGGIRMSRGFGIGQEFPVRDAPHRYDFEVPQRQAHEAVCGGHHSHLPARRRTGQAGRGPSPGLRPNAHLPSPVCPGHRQPDLDRS